jgi:hypothetical protein
MVLAGACAGELQVAWSVGQQMAVDNCCKLLVNWQIAYVCVLLPHAWTYLCRALFACACGRCVCTLLYTHAYQRWCSNCIGGLYSTFCAVVDCSVSFFGLGWRASPAAWHGDSRESQPALHNRHMTLHTHVVAAAYQQQHSSSADVSKSRCTSCITRSVVCVCAACCEAVLGCVRCRLVAASSFVLHFVSTLHTWRLQGQPSLG